MPTNVYPVREGFLYMAIGSDVQWRRLTERPRFASLGTEERTVLAVPSYDFDQDVLDLHADELPALEERCLYWVFALRRPQVRLVVVTSLPIPDAVADKLRKLAGAS